MKTISHLNWTTATETNNSGFEIQRKQDSSVWDRIGFVDGNGTTTEIQKYQFIDDISSISTNSLAYRLKQIDFDGSFEYSQEVTVNTITVTTFQLNQNFPNPFNPITTIKYSLPRESLVNIKIYNTLGEEMLLLINEEKPAGRYEIEFNAEDFSKWSIYLSNESW